MAKTIIKPAPMPDGPHPKGRHLLRIMFDDNEPPKNYIWAHPDGFFYRWETSRWVPININNPNDIADFIEDDSCDCNKDCGCNKSISRCDLDRILDRLKKDILSYTLKMIKEHSGDNEVERYLEEEILPRLTALEQIDHSKFLTEHQDLNPILNRLSALEAVDTATSATINNLTEIVNHLNDIDHSAFVKRSEMSDYYKKNEIQNLYVAKDSLKSLVENLGFVRMIDITLDGYNALTEKEPNVVYNITDAEAYHYDPTALTNRVSSLESDNTTNKNNISNLDERVQSLEAIDHDKFVTTDVLEGYVEEADLSPYATKNDLIGLATEQYVDNAVNAIEIPSLNGYATEEYVNNAIANVDDSDLRELVENNAFVTSASLNDLNDRTTILENAGFITEHQPLDNYATKDYVDSSVSGIVIPSTDGLASTEYVDNKVAGIVNSAPETLDTLKELSEALGNDANFATTMTTELGKKANIADLAAVATSGSYEDLINTPTIPTVPTNISAFTNDAGYLTSHQSLADYSTTSDVNSAIAAATTDMATQTWVEGNYEPKFTDLTGEADPEATAKTHTDDNKVYVTEVIDTE